MNELQIYEIKNDEIGLLAQFFYLEDVRGHSCLMLGKGKEERPVHLVCSPKIYFLAIITAYIPDENKWTDNFRKRLRR